MAGISATMQQGSRAAREDEIRSRCVLLENLLTPIGAADPEECHMTRMETGNECSRWGALLRVHVVAAFNDEAEPAPDHVAGRTFVEFESVDAGEECARAMDGRFFDGRRVSAAYYPVGAFYEGVSPRDPTLHRCHTPPAPHADLARHLARVAHMIDNRLPRYHNGYLR